MTPGPWLMQSPLPGIDGLPIAILGPDGKRLVAQVFSGEADARVIRVAPDALEILLRYWGTGEIDLASVEEILLRAGSPVMKDGEVCGVILETPVREKQ